MQAGCLLVLTGANTTSIDVLFLRPFLCTFKNLCPALCLSRIAVATYNSIHGSIAHNEQGPSLLST